MKYLVQKFGGTSLANSELREMVAQKIIRAKNEGYSPVVVVSAIGRQGDPYATDTLLEFVEKISPDIPPRELDTLMSCGEIISGVAMVATLRAKGYNAVFLTGSQAGIITDDCFTDAHIQEINPALIHKYAHQDAIVIVAGFQGVTKDGDVTTLGRGGSDTTAAALGVALNAEAIDIYTDVDGIMTADPRIVDDAKTLNVVTYNEIVQLAHEGAKVIHPRAVEIAMQKNIPLRVKCTFSDAPGTLVTAQSENGPIEIQKDKVITGIAHIPNVTQLKIITANYPEIEDAHLKIFKAMALAGISVDFINVYPEAVIFTVKDQVSAKAIEILQNMGFAVEAVPGCAKVSAVGAGMAGVPGVMARIVEALAEEKIKILQTADSHSTIWCLVKQADMERAIRALHKKFKLNE
ncbi:aspartate kinase [Thermincola potens]|uniref:Aspartokinase n=1 Tax=Thermincola potens (strain JR) TaxID=635013 RepID=D5XF36_THEPJ|nr:aspartate kinase [Thermincola potens]ADG82257.1 aspartate kinase [Thermincola potens JR]